MVAFLIILACVLGLGVLWHIGKQNCPTNDVERYIVGTAIHISRKVACDTSNNDDDCAAMAVVTACLIAHGMALKLGASPDRCAKLTANEIVEVLNPSLHGYNRRRHMVFNSYKRSLMNSSELALQIIHTVQLLDWPSGEDQAVRAIVTHVQNRDREIAEQSRRHVSK